MSTEQEDRYRVKRIAEAAAFLNRSIDDASLVGLEVRIDVVRVDRVGPSAYDQVNVTVKREIKP